KRACVGQPDGNGYPDSEADPKDGDCGAKLLAKHRTQDELPEYSEVRDHPPPSICPSRILKVRFAYPAASSECVARIIVRPISRFKRARRFITSVPLSESRLPVGSSARINSGRVTTARATAVRCISPPESSAG